MPSEYSEPRAQGRKSVHSDVGTTSTKSEYSELGGNATSKLPCEDSVLAEHNLSVDAKTGLWATGGIDGYVVDMLEDIDFSSSSGASALASDVEVDFPGES